MILVNKKFRKKLTASERLIDQDRLRRPIYKLLHKLF